jgi:hypothetical protein
MGHILCSGSNDHTTKFWCRNRPGDTLKDKYNLPSKGGEVVEERERPEPGTVSQQRDNIDV